MNPRMNYDYTLQKNVRGKPWITVSARGISNGLSDIPNDGADFGPDTPGTQTSGIQEAHNYRVSLAQLYAGEPYSFIPKVFLLSGTYICNNDIVVYPNQNGVLGTTTTLEFEGEGRNSTTQIVFQGNSNYGFDYSGAPAGTNICLRHLNVRAGNTNLTSLINAQLPTNAGGNYADFEDIQLASGSGTLSNGIMISGISFLYMYLFSSEIATSSTNFINITGSATGAVRYRLEGIRGANAPINIGANIDEMYIDLKSPTSINITSSVTNLNLKLRGQGGAGYIINNAGTINNLDIDQYIRAGNGFITNSGTINKLKIRGVVAPIVSSGSLIVNSGTIKEYEFNAVQFTNGSFQTNNLGYSSTAGTTAGTVNMQNVAYTTNYKKYIIQFSGYENSTTTNQTINYPMPFSSYAIITGNNTGLTISASTTGITITSPNSTTTYSGIVIIEGY